MFIKPIFRTALVALLAMLALFSVIPPVGAQEVPAPRQPVNKELPGEQDQPNGPGQVKTKEREPGDEQVEPGNEPVPRLQPLAGREAIILVGETSAGFLKHSVTDPTPALSRAYSKLGFVVQIVRTPADTAPIEAALKQIQNRYPTGGTKKLTDLLVHFVGHGIESNLAKLGWMAFAPPSGNVWSLSPHQLGSLVGKAFPDNKSPYQKTSFSAVFDGCSIYSATSTYPAGISTARSS